MKDVAKKIADLVGKSFNRGISHDQTYRRLVELPLTKDEYKQFKQLLKQLDDQS